MIGKILELSMSDGLTLDPRVPETMVTSFCQRPPDKTYSILAPPEYHTSKYYRPKSHHSLFINFFSAPETKQFDLALDLC